MDDASLREQIEKLVGEEHELLEKGEGGGPDEARHARLTELKVELDRCWDLLRQRKSHEQYGLDPDETSVRDSKTVEGYEQ